MLTVKNLKKKIGAKEILKGISFELTKGQIGIFLGGSGVGKSTLLRILNNLESYDSGEFTFAGKTLDLENVNHDHTVGMVFQHFNLFEHLTVLENITLALIKLQGKTKQEARVIATMLLARYGLAEKADLSIHQLSGGQKQRLAIARMIALNPQVICLDEPTSALDPQLTHQVAAFIGEMAKDERVVLITTHDMNLVTQLDGVMFLMQHGEIVESVISKTYNQNPDAYPLIQSFVNPIFNRS